MADWTNLPNLAVGVGGLPSGTTVTALRDNPIAITEGAEGAPRIRDNAVAPSRAVAQTDMPTITGVTATDTEISNLHWDGDFSTISPAPNDTSWFSSGDITIKLLSGVLRFRAVRNTSSVNEVRLIKNGSVVTTFVAEGENTMVIDVSVAPNDVFSWEQRRTTDSTFLMDTSTFSIRGSEQYVRVGALVRSSLT